MTDKRYRIGIPIQILTKPRILYPLTFAQILIHLRSIKSLILIVLQYQLSTQSPLQKRLHDLYLGTDAGSKEQHKCKDQRDDDCYFDVFVLLGSDVFEDGHLHVAGSAVQNE